MNIFPAASLDVLVTLVVPKGKALPGLWVGDNVCEPELSVAVGSVQDTFPVAVTFPVHKLTCYGHIKRACGCVSSSIC